MPSCSDVMLRQLAVMDETAITLCKENDIHVVVFNLTTPGNVLRCGQVARGTSPGGGRSWLHTPAGGGQLH